MKERTKAEPAKYEVIRCPKCDHAYVNARLRTADYRCRVCGAIFQRKAIDRKES